MLELAKPKQTRAFNFCPICSRLIPRNKRNIKDDFNEKFSMFKTNLTRILQEKIHDPTGTRY